MRLLLANYGKPGADLHFPLSLAYIAGALNRAGCDFGVLDCYQYPYPEQKRRLFEEIRRGNYGAVGFSVFLGNYSYRDLKELSRELRREFPGLKIIVGGPMATCIPEKILTRMDIDAAVLGEGELSAPLLMDALSRGDSLAGVPGVAWKDGAEIRINRPAARIQDLDSLHPLPYGLFPMDFYMSYLEKTGRCFGLLSSRGCYSRCTFCFLTYGKKMTFRSPASIIGEMELLKRSYGVTRFNFLDDNFMNVPKAALELCSMMRALPFRPSWRFQGRVDRMEDEIMREFVSSGLCGMTLGLESGSDRMLSAIKKGITVAQSERAVALCRRHEVPFSSNFIIGFPEETDETLAETRDFLVRNAINTNVWINFIVCYPGTPLYDYALKNGRIRDEEDYLMGLGPLGEKPYVNISRWNDEELEARRENLMAGLAPMRDAR